MMVEFIYRLIYPLMPLNEPFRLVQCGVEQELSIKESNSLISIKSLATSDAVRRFFSDTNSV